MAGPDDLNRPPIEYDKARPADAVTTLLDKVRAGKATLTIELKYYEGRPVIDRLERVSRPGLRVYRGKDVILKTLGDLVQLEISDMMKFRNFGKKSLAELEQLVSEKNLTFGMDLAKYKLEED